ncbi:MAG: EpsI family protein [Verrucomicrobiae bacterium]|nr:EpsI family protein [Verrucomicrobiae bacterium]
MNRQRVIIVVMALVLIGGTATVLSRVKSNQRLGAPGVTTEPIPGSRNLRVVLPERVLHYESEWIEPDALVTNTLPADTSYGQRRYFDPNNPEDQLQLSVVLMGADRTSLHKPQFCLEGAGWQIDGNWSLETSVPIERPQRYELPIIRLVSTRVVQTAQGAPVTYRGVYVYWFVADGALSGDMSGLDRMWRMAKHLLRTGELQRWAYVSLFAVCAPGQEEATFDRIKRFIAAAVPEFQLTPRAEAAAATAAIR